jgi:DNA-binding SARP family transcriptional activator
MRSSARRLIAYLALHPHGVGTDALTDALFPDSTESKARALRNTASSDARRVIRILGRPDAVQRTYQDLTDRLKAMHARPSSATNKLLNSLSTAD